MQVKTRASQKAFTLIELAIVLVVISLIVAGVVSGQSIVENARVRAQASDLQQYTVAFNTFQAQYDAVPGDMSNATSFWSGATNGNGNGRYESGASVTGPNTTAVEKYTIFQHLSSALMIPGAYDNTYVFKQGYPELKIVPGKAMMAGYYIDAASGGLNYQLSNSELLKTVSAALYLNINTPGATGVSFDDFVGVMTPTQAYNLDAKVDDGQARGGLFKGYSGYNIWTLGSDWNCLSSNDSNTYAMSVTKRTCFAEYILKK